MRQDQRRCGGLVEMPAMLGQQAVGGAAGDFHGAGDARGGEQGGLGVACEIAGEEQENAVGAFAAGLILEEVHYKDFVQRGEHGLEHLVHPIAGFLAPVFFVQMGMLTDITRLFDVRVAILGLGLTIAGVIGKAVSGYAISRREPVDRLTVGLGMAPRGEVGLIFANLGLGVSVAGRPVVDASTYSAIVMMVILTTLMTPPALKWRFGSRPPETAPTPS